MPNLPATWLSQQLAAPRQALARLLDAQPSQCTICRRWPSRRLCADCCARWAAPVARCRSCAMAVPDGVDVCGACLREPPPLTQCVAAVDYAYPWRSVLGEFKFRGDTGLARSLAQLLLRPPQAGELLARCDLLMAMPLSPQRLRERGFHQTLLLARAVARQVQGPGPGQLHATLVRRHHTALPQHDLARAQRLRQLRAAFSVEPAQRPLLQGRTVLLLDDVMTTGASLHALATCLRRAGAAEVNALVLARTPRP